MKETRLEFWNRQTLREKPAQILADWKKDNKKLARENKNLKIQLEEANKLITETNKTEAEDDGCDWYSFDYEKYIKKYIPR